MTRAELAMLCEAIGQLERGHRHLAMNTLLVLRFDAEDEHAAEDAHQDRAEADAYPVNAEAA